MSMVVFLSVSFFISPTAVWPLTLALTRAMKPGDVVTGVSTEEKQTLCV